MNNKLFEETCKARDKIYASIGEVEPDVIAHIINPTFTGGPSWPALRQSFSVIHRNNSTIVISNGLSDPFNDVEELNSGFKIEVFAETKEKIEGNISDSSLFKLVYATAQQAASSGQIVEFVETYKVITMELFADDCGLHEYQNDSGMVGIMIGIESPELPKYTSFPGGNVLLASVQILTPAELEYVAETRAEGRNNLHEKFKSSGVYHYLFSSRESLIESKQSSITNTIENNLSQIEASKKRWWKFW